MMLMRPSSLTDKYRRAMRYELIKWLALKPMAMRLFSKIYVRDDTESAKEAMRAVLTDVVKSRLPRTW